MRPVPADEHPVPAKDRLGSDEEGRPALPWHEPGEGRDDCPVGPAEPGARDLAAQDGQLLAKNEDLGILGDGVHVMDAQELEDATDQAVEEAERHGRQDRGSGRGWSSRGSGCWTLQAPSVAAIRKSTALRVRGESSL